MVLKPFFSYFGSKHRIARTYPPPEHADLVEPFAGSASYALHYPTRRVLLVEKNPVVAALWAWLIEVRREEVLRIPLFGRGVESVDDMKGIAPEAKTLVGFWIERSQAKPASKPGAWMKLPHSQTNFWGFSARLRVAQQVQWIRHWRVVEGTYEDAPDVEATWFVDPPYERLGDKYPAGRPDFAALAAWVRRRRGLAVVCEQHGARWLPFKDHAFLGGNLRARGGRASREVVYVQRRASPSADPPCNLNLGK